MPSPHRDACIGSLCGMLPDFDEIRKLGSSFGVLQALDYNTPDTTTRFIRSSARWLGYLKHGCRARADEGFVQLLVSTISFRRQSCMSLSLFTLDIACSCHKLRPPFLTLLL